jgi:hypothetical protein
MNQSLPWSSYISLIKFVGITCLFSEGDLFDSKLHLMADNLPRLPFMSIQIVPVGLGTCCLGVSHAAIVFCI